MTEQTLKPVTILEINGEEVKAKATFAFDIAAKRFSEENEDKEGKKNKTPGFNVIYNGILERDTTRIADFWECATAYLGKKAPKREDIEQAIELYVDEHEDTINLLQGALQLMNNSGFFKQKSRQFWIQMNSAPKLVKEEDKETTVNGIDMLKETYKEIMGETPYSITAK